MKPEGGGDGGGGGGLDGDEDGDEDATILDVDEKFEGVKMAARVLRRLGRGAVFDSAWCGTVLARAAAADTAPAVKEMAATALYAVQESTARPNNRVLFTST